MEELNKVHQVQYLINVLYFFPSLEKSSKCSREPDPVNSSFFLSMNDRLIVSAELYFALKFCRNYFFTPVCLNVWVRACGFHHVNIPSVNMFKLLFCILGELPLYLSRELLILLPVVISATLQSSSVEIWVGFHPQWCHTSSYSMCRVF